MSRVGRAGSGSYVIALAVWLGLAAGLLEVGARVLCRAIHPTGRLYMMSRHFLWLTPLANMVLFVGVGIFMCLLIRLWPRKGKWLAPRLLLALAMLPPLMVAVPGVFPEAWFLLTLGIAVRMVSSLQANPARLRRLLLWSFPGLVGLVLVLAGSILAGDWLKQRREASRAFPPSDAPNVLLIVLDTVRRDRLSLYGYGRPTTPNLERLAGRGIRFDGARATAPWTLASHASLFTGRWPHELGVEWTTPIRNEFTTLAEYLGTRGYATAGFAANAQYCSYDTGLSRGFTYYEDYVLEKLSSLRTSILIEELLRTVVLVGARHEAGLMHSAKDFLTRWFEFGVRRDAAAVNRGFLGWLDRRRDTGRPFFAFLNYLDAHTPYLVPQGAAHHFGRKPQTDRELWIINDMWASGDKVALPRPYLDMARDSYDNCIAYLDTRLGELFDHLERRGLLDRTWILVTSDHGEGLGEHDLFMHGESLYATEIRVPLVIVPPSGSRSAAVVGDTVSLRQVPATVVDLLGLQGETPFPGRSLARLWSEPSEHAGPDDGDTVFSELPGPNPSDPNLGRSPAHRGPLISLAEDRFSYIRNEGTGSEELFDERDDPRELSNLVAKDAMKPTLERFRARLEPLRGRPR